MPDAHDQRFTFSMIRENNHCYSLEFDVYAKILRDTFDNLIMRVLQSILLRSDVHAIPLIHFQICTMTQI